MLVFDKFSQPLAAAYKWDLGIAGTYMRLSACPWPVTVILYKGGQVIGQMNNMLAGDYVEGIAFDAVSVMNGATAQTVDVQISGGGAGSNRVLGEVSVIDGGKARTLAGQAFAWANGCAALAGNYSKSQLMNPAGSGKRVIVKAFNAAVSAATPVLIHTQGAQLANLSVDQPVASKCPTGAAPIARSRYETVAAATVAPRLIDYLQFSAAGSYQKVLQEPIVLEPGWGLVVESAFVAITVNSSFEWIEEPV